MPKALKKRTRSYYYITPMGTLTVDVKRNKNNYLRRKKQGNAFSHRADAVAYLKDHGIPTLNDTRVIRRKVRKEAKKLAKTWVWKQTPKVEVNKQYGEVKVVPTLAEQLAEFQREEKRNKKLFTVGCIVGYIVFVSVASYLKGQADTADLLFMAGVVAMYLTVVVN